MSNVECKGEKIMRKKEKETSIPTKTCRRRRNVNSVEFLMRKTNV
jgi:hypothetical protein